MSCNVDRRIKGTHAKSNSFNLQNIPGHYDITDESIDPFGDRTVSILQSQCSRKVRNTTIYDYTYKSLQKEINEIHEELNNDYEDYLLKEISKKKRFYKKFVKLSRFMINENMKNDNKEGLKHLDLHSKPYKVNINRVKIHPLREESTFTDSDNSKSEVAIIEQPHSPPIGLVKKQKRKSLPRSPALIGIDNEEYRQGIMRENAILSSKLSFLEGDFRNFKKKQIQNINHVRFVMDRLSKTEESTYLENNIDHYLRKEIIKASEKSDVDKKLAVKIANLNLYRDGHLAFQANSKSIKYVN